MSDPKTPEEILRAATAAAFEARDDLVDDMNDRRFVDAKESDKKLTAAIDHLAAVARLVGRLEGVVWGEASGGPQWDSAGAMRRALLEERDRLLAALDELGKGESGL